MLQGFSGQLDGWLARKPFEPLFVERLDAMFAAGDCPDAVVVFVDAWTSLGGSQFLNSTATGNYMDYLCDEVVPFVDGRLSDRAACASAAPSPATPPAATARWCCRCCARTPSARWSPTLPTRCSRPAT